MQDQSLVEVGLPALPGLGLNVLHFLLELLSTSVFGRLEDSAKRAASEVVLDHALSLADGTLPVGGTHGN